MGKLLEFTFYNPDQLEDEDFLAGFIARQDLATKILARLGTIKPRGMAQHRLIVGQRGMGKTSLLRRIGMGVRAEPALADVLLPLSFREEQYNVHNLHVFWCNCLDALGDWFEAMGREEDAKRLDSDVATLNAQEDDEEGSRALELFRSWMKREQRRPLLLLDNLDIIFAGLKNKQWSLRRVLQEPGGIVVIGASAAALEAAADREGAFYDFFQVDVLAKLEHHEILLCLRHMAQQREEPGRKVLQVLDRDPARIHVLYDLTGGNPRTLAFLYLVLETSGDEDVMRDLERLLDQATPLYKARVEELAPQARVVFDALALAWDPATAADLAGATGLDVSVVSVQLDRLVKEGIVEKTSLSSTSRAAFQVAERFFNIWYLMRHSSRRQRQRLRWLTEMLRRIYSPRELRERATGLLGGPHGRQLSSSAYCIALSDAVEDRELRAALRKSLRRSSLNTPDALLDDDLNSPITSGSGHVTSASEPAVEVYRKAIEHNPRDPGLWNGLGRLLRDFPEFCVEAEDAFRKAIELEPDGAQPWYNLGVLLAGPLNRPAEAEAAFCKAIGLDPTNSWSWCELGNLLEDLERHSEAEVAYRRAIEIDPVDPWSWVDLGSLLTDSLERHSDAEAAFRKAIELDPYYAWAWNELGRLLAGPLERFAEAEAALHKTIELDPQDALPWSELGQLFAGPLERHTDAEFAYRMAIELDPENAWYWDDLGDLLTDPLNRHEEAETAYRKAIELDPQNAWFWGDLGNLLASLPERHSEAEAAYGKAIEIDPNNACLWCQLGDFLSGPLGRSNEAELAYRRAIEIDSTHAGTWNNLGILLASALKRYDEAETAYRRASELEPKRAEPWNNLGNLLADSLDRYNEAEAAYRKATQLNPRLVEPWQNLAALLAGPLARHSEAETIFRKVIEIQPEDVWSWIDLGNLLADHFGRFDGAENAYKMAIRFAPHQPFAPANLAYLFLRQDGGMPAAETWYQEAVALLPWHGAGLLRAFHALAVDNFGTAQMELGTVLAEGHPELFTVYRNDLLRILQFAAERGNGEKLLAWLKGSDLGDRYWPLHVAYDAYLHGEELLMDVNPEVRSGARRLLAEMTPRPIGGPPPETGKKPARKRRAKRD